jgi:hypothetical protein
MYKGTVGAPKGNRWHFLLCDLSKYVNENYVLSYDYKKDSYFLERDIRKSKEKDFFIIIRTSKNCFRVMYHNKKTKKFIYESFLNSITCAEMIHFWAVKYN